MPTALDYKTQNNPTWCAGCGNYGILNFLKASMAAVNLSNSNTVLVSGIGCSGKLPHYVKTYGFEGIHGRVLPVATGIKLSNHKLKVIGIAGDGDAYGIGMCHFIHAMRRNIDITYIVHNNQVYGLTTGQTSPTSDKGFVTKSTPNGVIEEPVEPIKLALSAGATFIARGFVGEGEHLKNILIQALNHKGFALVDIFQPCVTFNQRNTYKWFEEKVYKLEEISGYNSTDKNKAFEEANKGGDKLPIGIFYKEVKQTYEDMLPQIKDVALVNQQISDIDIMQTLEEFM
jgi:2-oxoglutarate ferredoxin oxidoreductase subunit beta